MIVLTKHARKNYQGPLNRTNEKYRYRKNIGIGQECKCKREGCRKQENWKKSCLNETQKKMQEFASILHGLSVEGGHGYLNSYGIRGTGK